MIEGVIAARFTLVAPRRPYRRVSSRGEIPLEFDRLTKERVLAEIAKRMCGRLRKPTVRSEK